MNTRKRRQSTAESSPQQPRSTPSLSLVVMMALSFTIILIQVQAVTQGGARDLLPILAAGLLAAAGRSAPDHPEP